MINTHPKRRLDGIKRGSSSQAPGVTHSEIYLSRQTTCQGGHWLAKMICLHSTTSYLRHAATTILRVTRFKGMIFYVATYCEPACGISTPPGHSPWGKSNRGASPFKSQASQAPKFQEHEGILMRCLCKRPPGRGSLCGRLLVDPEQDTARFLIAGVSPLGSEKSATDAGVVGAARCLLWSPPDRLTNQTDP